MKNWFPFTDYDFYAYITSGVMLIAAVDYTFGGSVLVGRTEWTIIQGIFWTMISYLIGHVSAGLSSFFMEQILLKKLFTNPILAILGFKQSRWYELPFRYLFASEFSAFPETVSARINLKLKAEIGTNPLALQHPETLFQTAFSVARYDKDCEPRLDQFMNLYGFCRNTAFAAFVAALLLWIRTCQLNDPTDAYLALAALALGLGMFGRFIKFYSAYTREILRAFERAAL